MAYNQRWDAKVDTNHTEIVNQINAVPILEALDLSGVGKGCTDILIQKTTPIRVTLYLVEIKFEKGNLNPKQVEFHERFDCHVARNIEDIWEIVGF